MKVSAKIALGVLAVVFTLGLTYASIELPLLASSALIDHVDFPSYDSGRHPEKTEAFIGAHHHNGSLTVLGLENPTFRSRRQLSATGREPRRPLPRSPDCR